MTEHQMTERRKTGRRMTKRRILNAELDPRPNRDPTLNDRTPNDQTPKYTERRIGLNTEFEGRKTEHRKIPLLHMTSLMNFASWGVGF
jgi:hypothetical protein